MLALCLMLSDAYYAKSYAGIIGLGLYVTMHCSCLIHKGMYTLPVMEEDTSIKGAAWHGYKRQNL